jgi:hypothetical protein
METKTHNYKTILENEVGYIGYCQCCQMVNVCYKNSLFAFKIDDYQWFFEVVSQRKCMRQFYTSHGKELMLPTPMNNYYILFEESELNTLTEMIKESMFLIDTFKTLQNHN